MRLAIEIVKSILLPKFEKDVNFENIKSDTAFWNFFATALLDFEKSEETCKIAINNLGLNNPEKIIFKLTNIYNLYIKNLAETHVLGKQSEAIDYLLNSGNQIFKEEVIFLKNLENGIIYLERERIKQELPNAYENLLAELNKRDIKVIHLSWIKYAAAACVVFAAGIFFFKQSTNSNSNFIQSNKDNVVVSSVKKRAIEAASMKNIDKGFQSIKIEEITINTVSLNVLKNDYGFTPDKQKIKIVVNDQINRILSLNKAIKQYERLLKEIKYQPQYDNLKVLISEHKTELERCKKLESKYVFNGKELTLYSKLEVVKVLEYNGVFYLKRGINYYKLIISKQPQLFEKITDFNVLEALEKIIIKNE